MKRPNQRRPEKPFSVFWFALTITLTLVAFALATRFITPKIWQVTLAAPFWKLGVVFLSAHLFCAFAEFLFHRYVLHSPFPLLGRLYRQHTIHHSLTNVKLISVGDNQGKIFNRYPIIKEEQHEASYFPWYSLAGFIVAFLPIGIALQVFFPSWPFLFGITLSIAWSISLYEIIHMIEHLPFEVFWKPKVTHCCFGKFWTRIYCFHLRHHADVSSNENISGFFGFPIADVVFGTYVPWEQNFSHGDIIPRGEWRFEPGQPYLAIRILDRWFAAI
jgi:hemolysin III